MKKTLLMLVIIFSWCSIDGIGQTRILTMYSA